MNDKRRSLSGPITKRFTRQTNEEDSRRATICAQLPKVHIRIVPNIDNPSRSLIFDIVDRELELGTKLLVGRYSERHTVSDCLSFKSKVVSRCHCEIWVEQDGKLYIRDTKSSSGTFLNHVRLSPAGQESRSVEIHDGDLLQLGVDFQGGQEEVYRSVKMKFELNRRHTRPLSFSLTAFQNLRSMTTTTTMSNNTQDEEECCICLYALAPFQALFVAPCSHSYHFKCIRPLFESYPGFQCPLCRTYSDLEANIASEEVDSSLPSIEEQPTTSINRLATAIEQVDSIEPIESIEQIESIEPMESIEQPQPQPPVEPPVEIQRERKSSYILDKIKTVFFEKRKSNMISRKTKRQRPISFPHFMGEPSILTRQPTT